MLRDTGRELDFLVASWIFDWFEVLLLGNHKRPEIEAIELVLIVVSTFLFAKEQHLVLKNLGGGETVLGPVLSFILVFVFVSHKFNLFNMISILL